MNRRIPPRQILYPGNLLKIFLGSIFPSKIDEKYFNEFFKRLFKSKEENTFIPVNKARVGIYLIVEFLKKKFSKKKILMSPLTVFDIVNMVLCAGCYPDFIDFKKDSFDIDIDKLDQKLALDKDICAVLICNYQINTNIEEILKVTKKYKVEVILDCAISITSSLKKKSIVDYVNYSVFSFNLFKVIQSIHGGAVITSDNEFKDFLRNRQANWSIYNYRDLLNYFMKGVQIKILTLPLIYELFTFNLFKFGDLKNIKFIQNLSKNDPNPERKYNLNNSYKKKMNNGQVLEIYKNLEKTFLKREEREHNFLLYEEGIKNDYLKLIDRKKNLEEKNSYINFPILIKEDKKKLFSEHLYKNNIDHTKYFYRSCDDIECFKDFGEQCINSQYISKNIILLPIHNSLNDKKISQNIKIINSFLKY